MFGRPFRKTNPEELSTLCIYPENSWTTQRMCQSTKHCLFQLLPNTLSCNLGGTFHLQPWPGSCSVLESMQWKEMHQLLHRTWGGMILKGIFLSNFWNLCCIHAMKKQYTLELWQVLTGAVLPKLSHPNRRCRRSASVTLHAAQKIHTKSASDMCRCIRKVWICFGVDINKASVVQHTWQDNTALNKTYGGI